MSAEGKITTFEGLLKAAQELRSQIERESQVDTSEFVQAAEAANESLDQAGRMLSDIGADLSVVESETHPPGGEALAAALEDLKQEAGL